MLGIISGGYNLYPVYSNYLNNNNIKVPVISKVQENNVRTEELTLKGKLECKTCKERKYIDDSDENVSFKTPGHISPEASGIVVSAHESEHVNNARSESTKPGAELVSASVTLKTAICPECGKTYVSGGTTKTQIKYSDEQNPYQKMRKKTDELLLKGINIDYAA